MDVMDVADFFIATANEGNAEEDDGMTNMKLNKLLFFAQAASLQRFGKPLFDAPLEAWKYGPVAKEVYRTFRKYGRDSIKQVARPFDWKAIDPRVLELLCDVYRVYARDYSATGLMRKTHGFGTPWSKVYTENRNEIISCDAIKEWVDKQPLPLDEDMLPDSMVIVADLDKEGRPFCPRAGKMTEVRPWQVRQVWFPYRQDPTRGEISSCGR